MKIYLSASSISDYLRCKKKYFFRTNYPAYSVPTEEMKIGNIVHSIIEHHWDNEAIAIQKAKEQAKKLDISNAGLNSVLRYVDNFFIMFGDSLYEDDLIEHDFKLQLQSDVFMVGKFDRISILPDKIFLYDWKTGREFPKAETFANDVQFIIYKYALENMFPHRQPTLYYASLAYKSYKQVIVNSESSKILFSDIIPNMLYDIRNDKLYKTGLFRKECRNCAFINICLNKKIGSEKDVVESTNFIDK